MLYRQNGGAPAPLPFSAYTPEGLIRTDLANHSDSIVECGFEPAPEQPEFDPKTQQVVWDAETEAWQVQPLSSLNTASNILSAPAKGFGGPTGKELFNGNR